MSFLLGTVEKGTPEQAQSVVHQILDLLWLFMEVRFLTAGSGQAVRLHPGKGRYSRVFEKAPIMAALASLPRTMRYRIASSS